jgi:hypothetical protein
VQNQAPLIQTQHCRIFGRISYCCQTYHSSFARILTLFKFLYNSRFTHLTTVVHPRHRNLEHLCASRDVYTCTRRQYVIIKQIQHIQTEIFSSLIKLPEIVFCKCFSLQRVVWHLGRNTSYLTASFLLISILRKCQLG